MTSYYFLSKSFFNFISFFFVKLEVKVCSLLVKEANITKKFQYLIHKYGVESA